MGPATDVDRRCGDRLAPRLGHAPERAFLHPVVDERLRCRVAVAAVEGGGGLGHRAADAVGFVRRRRLGIDQREQGRLIEDQGADIARRQVERRAQGDRPAVGMADQDQRRAGLAQHRLDQRHLVGERDHPVRRPFRALARAVGIGQEDLEARREQLHQRAPLARAARVRMQADDPGPAAGAANERQPLSHQPSGPPLPLAGEGGG